MDKSVIDFYNKNEESNYADKYNYEHSPRLDAFVKQFYLEKIKEQRIADFGGGLGFLGSRLDKSNKYWVFDGFDTPKDKYVCELNKFKCDLDYDKFSENYNMFYQTYGKFDISFCLETLEHLTNPYNCLTEIKKLTKKDGYIYISIPNVRMTHNYIYPALMWNKENFIQFLEQMALPVEEYWLFDGNWPSDHFCCRNADWTESKMLFYKDEEKFRGKTPLEAVNI